MTEGQSVTLTCVVHVKDVGMKGIKWFKDGERVLDQFKLSQDRCVIETLLTAGYFTGV